MDWTQIAVTFVVTLPATIAAITAMIASIRNTHKINENTTITKTAAAAACYSQGEARDTKKATKQAVEEIKTAVNGRLDQLLIEAKQKAFAEGYARARRELDANCSTCSNYAPKTKDAKP